jgi:hypothetical protein
MMLAVSFLLPQLVELGKALEFRFLGPNFFGFMVVPSFESAPHSRNGRFSIDRSRSRQLRLAD